MTQEELMGFLESGKGEIRFSNNDWNYTLIVLAYDDSMDDNDATTGNTSVLFLGGAYAGYNREEGEVFFGVGNNAKLEYAGFYKRETRQLYDSQYLLRRAIVVPNGFDWFEETCYGKACFDELVKAANKAVAEEMNKRIAARPEQYLNEKLLSDSHYDFEYLEKYGADSEARKAFFSGLDRWEFKLNRRKDYSTHQMILYVSHGDRWVCKQADIKIAECAGDIAFNLLKEKLVNERLAALVADITGRHYLRRAISDAITDQKTVRVKIVKDGIEFEFQTGTASLKVTDYPYYSTYRMAAKDGREFEKVFGYGKDYDETEVVSITHGKKVLYSR